MAYTFTVTIEEGQWYIAEKPGYLKVIELWHIVEVKTTTKGELVVIYEIHSNRKTGDGKKLYPKSGSSRRLAWRFAQDILFPYVKQITGDEAAKWLLAR